MCFYHANSTKNDEIETPPSSDPLGFILSMYYIYLCLVTAVIRMTMNNEVGLVRIFIRKGGWLQCFYHQSGHFEYTYGNCFMFLFQQVQFTWEFLLRKHPFCVQEHSASLFVLMIVQIQQVGFSDCFEGQVFTALDQFLNCLNWIDGFLLFFTLHTLLSFKDNRMEEDLIYLQSHNQTVTSV